MDFVINRKIFGTDFHLLFKNGKGTRVYDLPEGVIDVSSKEMWLITKLYNIDLPTFPPKKYKNSFYGIVERDEFIPWSDVMPREVYTNSVKEYLNTIKELLLNLDLFYYENCYKKHIELFSSLKPAKINQSFYWETIKTNAVARSFLPINGFAKKVEYDYFSSATGRLTVRKGPMILTLKKEIRNSILESRFGDNGSIYYFDYSSLEPRVLLSFMGKKHIPKDLYSAILKEVNVDIPRAAIKTAIISRLYGAQEQTIHRQLKDIVAYPDTVVNLVDDYFEIDKAKNKVLQEYYKSATATLYNLYERPIKFENVEPHKLLNYFIQSTAVDTALFGFSKIIQKIKLAGIEKKVIPLYVLHDALILDVHNDYEYLIPKMLNVGAKNIPKFKDNIFYLEKEKMV